MKTIRRFFNNAEAAFARTLLLSAGIEAVLADENANVLGPGIFAPGGVRLMVPEESVGRATEILEGSNEEFSPLPEGFVPPEETVGESKETTPPPLEGFPKVRECIPAGLCLLAAMGIMYALFVQFAPLHWTHSAKDLLKMGITAAKNKDFARAIKYFNAAAVLAPENDKIFYDRGLAYYKEKDYENAIADFTKTLHLNPKHAWSLSMLGMSYGH